MAAPGKCPPDALPGEQALEQQGRVCTHDVISDTRFDMRHRLRTSRSSAIGSIPDSTTRATIRNLQLAPRRENLELRVKRPFNGSCSAYASGTPRPPAPLRSQRWPGAGSPAHVQPRPPALPAQAVTHRPRRISSSAISLIYPRGRARRRVRSTTSSTAAYKKASGK